MPAATAASFLALPSRALAGATLGALLAALVDIVASNLTTSFDSMQVRCLHAAWSLGSMLALGVACDALLLLTGRGLRARRTLGLCVFIALSCAAVSWLLGAVFVHRAHHLFEGRYATALASSFVLGSGLGVAACVLIAQRLGRLRVWYLLGVAIAMLALVLNELLFRDDYSEVHVNVVCNAALLLGVTLTTRFELGVEELRSLRQRPALLAPLLLALLALVPPPNHVRLSLVHSPGAAGAWLLATTYWRLPRFEAAPDARIAARWLRARPSTTQPPPSAARLFDGAPVVVLLSIDAVRADTLLDPEQARQLPTLSRIAREGAFFTQARSPGTQTAISLTALFSGKYFSELAWAPYAEGDYRYLYAAADPTPRWPELLSAHGIATTKLVSIAFLANAFGVAPGFSDEQMVTSGKAHASGESVIAPLLQRLRAAKRNTPLFVYAHLTEPHEPYDRGKLKTGSDHARYLSEVAAADGFVLRVLRALSTPALARRSMLVVTSDHGEAFGEHDTHEHAKSLYDELLRVPLLVWGKRVMPRRLAQPVSLIDLGPTLLDAFGVAAPGDLAGESLLPLLAGRDVQLTRPMIAEGRLRRAVVLDSLKVIVDQRVHTIEAYDLARDPGELHNLYDTAPERFAGMLGALQAYFDAHSHRAPGYQLPYRP